MSESETAEDTTVEETEEKPKCETKGKMTGYYIAWACGAALAALGVIIMMSANMLAGLVMMIMGLATLIIALVVYMNLGQPGEACDLVADCSIGSSCVHCEYGYQVDTIGQKCCSAADKGNREVYSFIGG